MLFWNCYTSTNVNYTKQGIIGRYKRQEPAIETEFPYKEGNFEWVRPILFIKEFPFPNETGYVNGSGILTFPIPLNTTIYKNLYQDYSK